MLLTDRRGTRRQFWKTGKGKMTCSAENWVISAEVKAFDGDEQFFEKMFEKVIPRDMM